MFIHKSPDTLTCQKWCWIMERKFHIKLSPVEARAVIEDGSAKVKVGGLDIDVFPEPEAGGPEKGLTPLGLLAASLASCEVLMSKMIARMLGINGLKVEVLVNADIQLGVGLRSLEIRYKFHGVDEKTARDIAAMVKSQCPIYNTLAKEGVDVKELVQVA